ncbi:MAG: DEAD/DEAH box helicase [Proteobacteria bacterium]|nr:DEAD/DEAH box helicase [Pseudomonadota bacterium]
MSASPLAGFLDSLPAVCGILRDYQREQLATLSRALRSGYRRIVLQAPTGSGKTHLIAGSTAAAHQAGLRVLILATRTRLVRQIHQRLVEFAIPHGVIAAPLPQLLNSALTVQLSSVDTLHRRAVVDRRMPLPPADVVLFDEAHLAGADSRLAILDTYPQALRIGLTATPARKSGRGLGAVFDALIAGPAVLELIASGMLVRPRVFNVPIVNQADLEKLPKDAAQDYQSKALGALLSRPKLVGEVVGNWLSTAAGKPTLCFAVNKAHGAQLVQEFLQAGVAAELVTDADSENTREQVVARLESGATRVAVNCFLMSYGVDIPMVECIVLARPTRSLVQYLQMAGRGMRPASGKTEFLLIDHGRVVESLGLPHAPRDWTLDQGRNVNAEAREQCSRKSSQEKPRTCPECQYIWLISEQGEACRECGWLPAPRPRGIEVEPADLGELDYDNAPSVTPQSPEAVQFFRESLGDYARSKPQKWHDAPNTARAACWHATREKFGLTSERIPSAYWELMPLAPNAATSGWLKWRRIRWAKRRSRVAA